jgi:hypothetical protein
MGFDAVLRGVVVGLVTCEGGEGSKRGLIVLRVVGLEIVLMVVGLEIVSMEVVVHKTRYSVLMEVVVHKTRYSVLMEEGHEKSYSVLKEVARTEKRLVVHKTRCCSVLMVVAHMWDYCSVSKVRVVERGGKHLSDYFVEKEKAADIGTVEDDQHCIVAVVAVVAVVAEEIEWRC